MTQHLSGGEDGHCGYSLIAYFEIFKCTYLHVTHKTDVMESGDDLDGDTETRSPLAKCSPEKNEIYEGDVKTHHMATHAQYRQRAGQWGVAASTEPLSDLNMLFSVLSLAYARTHPSQHSNQALRNQYTHYLPRENFDDSLKIVKYYATQRSQPSCRDHFFPTPLPNHGAE